MLPPPPRTQALKSATFRPPPLDGSLTLPELFDWHLTNSPRHRLFVYANEDGSTRNICWPEAVGAVLTGAKILRERFGWTPGMDPQVVVFLSASDTITHFITQMSIMRAGYIPFPVSPLNSPLAITSLLSKVAATHILYGHEHGVLGLAHNSIDVLKKQYPSASVPTLSPAPQFEDLFLDSNPTTDAVKALPFEPKGPDATALILHSSGSHDHLSQPITLTNHRLAQLAVTPWFGEQDLTGQVFSLHTIPMFHAMGVFQLFWTASTGLVLAAFEPKSPPVVPTLEKLYHAAVRTETDIILCVPTLIEAWARNPEYVKWLASRRGIVSGGGPLNQTVGDSLTSQGVTIYMLYGCCGYDWNYFKFADLITPEMVPRGNGTYELVLVPNKFCTPSVLNTKINGTDCYATSDLFTPHPNKLGYYRVYGRVDDQIVHTTGEKVKNIINQDIHLRASVMFGRGYPRAGVIVDPTPEHKFDPADAHKLEEFRSRIWPTFERMNAYAPQYSRLRKEMIVVAKPVKPFHYTGKGNTRRQAILSDYSDEIEESYCGSGNMTHGGNVSSLL
ncbi:hypothetical protein BD779DRAFT_1498243 [Infundibulicybe gibba]|nr:hypothetical protein BD779DRAFT_1498243 [Infundibulicybe gibba]